MKCIRLLKVDKRWPTPLPKGRIIRCVDELAQMYVSAGDGEYCPKEEWKKQEAGRGVS